MEKCALRVAISYLGVVRRKLIARERNQNKIFDTLDMKLNARFTNTDEYCNIVENNKQNINYGIS